MATISSPPPLSSTPTLSLLQKCKTMPELRQIHAHMIKTGLVSHTFAVSRLVAVCSLPGVSTGLDYALSVFLRIKDPNAFIYFTLIKAFADGPTPSLSISLYSQMLCSLDCSTAGTEFSIPSVLKACGRVSRNAEGRQIHGQILKTHFKHDMFVMNSVIRMYVEGGEIERARQVFDKMCRRDVISWNSMIAGYFKAGDADSACWLFNKMPEKDLVSWNTMIDGCGKCGKYESARGFFDEMGCKDVVSWTCMISACVLGYRPKDALDLFGEMLGSGMKPDVAAIVGVLAAVADLGFVEEGKWIHAYVGRHKIDVSSGVVGSALIDMYSKCGYVEDAYNVFHGISDRRHIGDWNSMISGFAIHGLGKRGLEIFSDMRKMDIEPDDITFIAVLIACSHGGLVQEGEYYFKLMHETYKIIPKIQHYGCMVDLYSRAGSIKEALGFIAAMPIEPDLLMWKSILSACMKHGGDMLTAEQAALRAIELSPNDSSCYVLLSNVYAKASRWDDVGRVRSKMKERDIRKVPGRSSILVNGKIHEFLAGNSMDTTYRTRLLQKLEETVCRVKLAGYEPDLTQVLLDVEEDEKEKLLGLHSEKMALAFGLINLKKGAPIHIVKNLRVCCDCHSFIKLVSKVYNHQIVVRDQNRFHHFNHGSCSCNEYW